MKKSDVPALKWNLEQLGWWGPWFQRLLDRRDATEIFRDILLVAAASAVDIIIIILITLGSRDPEGQKAILKNNKLEWTAFGQMFESACINDNSFETSN